MIFLIIFIVGMYAFSLPDLIKKKQKKEIVVFLVLTMAAFVAGYIYTSDPFVHKSILGFLKKAVEK